MFTSEFYIYSQLYALSHTYICTFPSILPALSYSSLPTLVTRSCQVSYSFAVNYSFAVSYSLAQVSYSFAVSYSLAHSPL